MDMIKRALTPEQLKMAEEAMKRELEPLRMERVKDARITGERGNRHDRRRAAKLARQKAPA